MTIADLIPGSLLPVLHADPGEKDARRLTLLYKQNDRIVCLLTRGLTGVAVDRPVQDAFLFQIFGPESVEALYADELTFSLLPAGSHPCLGVEKKSADADIERTKIPFQHSGDFISEVVDERLDHEIHVYFEVLNASILQGCNSVAERGLLRTLLRPGARARQISANLKAAKSQLYRTVNGFFHEERESQPVPRRLLAPADRKKKDFFKIPGRGTALVAGLKLSLLLLLLAFTPAGLIDMVEKSLRGAFQKRFDRMSNDEERDLVALSEFAVANPKFVPGIKRGFREMKAIVDLGTYALQIGLTWLACQLVAAEFAPLVAAPAILTGLVKLNNARRSRFRDFSGIIASALNQALHKKHHLAGVGVN